MNIKNNTVSSNSSNTSTGRRRFAVLGLTVSLSLCSLSACDVDPQEPIMPGEELVEEPDSEGEARDLKRVADSGILLDLAPQEEREDLSSDKGWVYLGQVASSERSENDERSTSGDSINRADAVREAVLSKAMELESQGAYLRADERAATEWDGGYEIAMTTLGDVYAKHSFHVAAAPRTELPPSFDMQSTANSQDESEDSDSYRTDNRTRLRNVQSPQMRSMGALFWEAMDDHGNLFEFSNCTATKVGPRVVITAAHCLNGNLVPQIFDAGRDGGTMFARFRVATGHFWVHPKYPRKLKQGKFDVAILVLQDAPEIVETGFWGLKTEKRKRLKKKKVTSCGYPGEDPNEVKGTSVPWCSNGKIKRVYEERIRSSTYLTPGQSGSAVWSQGEPGQILGIHSGDGLLKEWHARVTGTVIDALCDLRRRYTSQYLDHKDPHC